MLQNITILICILIASANLSAQTNYKSYMQFRTLHLAQPLCTIDTNQTIQNIKLLKSFDIDKYKREKKLFYTDLGICYNKYYFQTEDPSILDSTLYYFAKVIEYYPKASNTLWNLSILYIYSKHDCEKGISYLNMFDKIGVRKRYGTPKRIAKMREHCIEK